MAKTPAEEWAETTGRQMFAAHMAKAADKAWRAALATYGGAGRGPFFFWLGAEGGE